MLVAQEAYSRPDRHAAPDQGGYKAKKNEPVTPKSSALAFRQLGRAEGLAQGLEMAGQQLREAEEQYLLDGLKYLERLDKDDVRWGYVMTVRPILNTFLQIADQFDALAKGSVQEANTYSAVAASLITTLDAQMKGSRGRELGKRVVAAGRALAGTPPSDVG